MRVLVQQAFYQHESLGPGAPLAEITGQGEGDGYYDWAGRRLFLADGEPDPMCPGAYRYQHNPAACDPEAPDSDPRSPRYEPMHLRHRPGDTWIIDTNRPHDPFDPGPFGSPGWYKDERTGRHRRDETPDPLPAEGWVPPANAWFPGTADWPEPQAVPPNHHASTDRPDRGGSDRPTGTGARSSDRGGADRPPPWGSRGRPVSSDPDEPPHRHWGDRAGRDAPAPDTDRPLSRPWDRTEPNGENPTNEPDSGEFRFSKLREDAFDRFMANSAQLRAAHFAPERPYLRERAAWVLRWLVWILACGLAPMPAPLAIRQLQPEPTASQSIPAQRAAESRSASTLATAPAPAPERADNADHIPAATGFAPGAAIAAAINGARAARSVIASRESRSSADLATAVRHSANRTDATSAGGPAHDRATHWRTRPRQSRPRPTPRTAPGSYMTAWEQAFDTSHTLISGAAA
ncbi:hypothetical protein [Glycomyces sp. YM15]|uniref:hypothetical protein n=1 Tax=Glycomyces sp. YM15 TaxID=2800446 RepID=UPI001963A21B|nr:hypothetical protein [Glycomyces sp. YM15]